MVDGSAQTPIGVSGVAGALRGSDTPVSVILYVHNGARYLRQAIESILAQTHVAFELCAVDDGSDDATPMILQEAASRDSRVRVERQVAHGRTRLHETVNAALAMTRHDLIAIANADDIWRRDKLAVQVAAFEAEPGLDVCHHDAVFIDEHGLVNHGQFRNTPSPYVLRDVRPWHFVAGNPVPNPTVVFHRRVLRRIGLQEVGDMHDHQFWFKAAVHGCRFLALPDRLIRYRIHEESHSTASSRAGAIRIAHGESVAMMLDRLPLDAVFPELGAVEAADPRNRAWAHHFLGSLLWPRHVELAGTQFRAALRLGANPAVKCALAMVMAHRGDRYQAMAMIRDAAAAGVSGARILEGAPELLLDAAAPGWHGAEPPIAAVVRADPGLPPAVEECPTEPRADVVIVLSRAEVTPGAVSVALRRVVLERGGTPTSVTLLTPADVVEPVVAGYEQFRWAAGELADCLAVEAQVVEHGGIESVADAHLLEGAEVEPLVRPASTPSELRPEPALAG